MQKLPLNSDTSVFLAIPSKTVYFVEDQFFFYELFSFLLHSKKNPAHYNQNNIQ